MQHGADGKGVMPPERFSDRLRIRSDQSALHDSGQLRLALEVMSPA